MLAHPEFLADFGAALQGGPLPVGIGAPEAERRFAVYRNNVATSLSQALATRFPVIRRLVGETYFSALATAYRRADPPRSPVLAEWGEGFAEFLADFAPLAAYPYLPDVARIEVARGRAFHAADADPVDPVRLAQADPERVRLILHPSVIVLRLSHPAVSIWARHQPGGDAVALGSGPQTALILRDAGLNVPVRALSAADAALLAGLLRGATLAEAAGALPGHDPAPILTALMAAGAIIDVEE